MSLIDFVDVKKPINKKYSIFDPNVDKPYNMQIEFVEGCSRMCDFCGIWGIWDKQENRKIKFMLYDLAEKIAKNIGSWLNGKRIEFAMHGEPLLHPKIYELVSVFREYTPKSQLQLTTNGDMLCNGKIDIDKLFYSGLNILIIDNYGNRDFISIIGKVKDKEIKILNYYTDEFNPYHFHSNKIKIVLIMDDIGKVNNKRKARKILNHAGNVNFDLVRKYGVFPVRQPLQKKCSRVFRELTVHYDGTVSICCIDWKHEFIVGNVNNESLEEIWSKQEFQDVRNRLYNKDRNFSPCNKCDYNGGFRLGFLKPVKI